MTAKTFRELRAWQLAYAFKLRIYDLIEGTSISNDDRIESQLREGAASAPSQIAEGFGRFDPMDFARFVKMARASLVECQNHLQDAVDRRHITESMRRDHDKLAQDALMEIGGLLDYLQSPEAKKNAEWVRQKRFERRAARNRRKEPTHPNREPEPETRTRNQEPGTRNGS